MNPFQMLSLTFAAAIFGGFLLPEFVSADEKSKLMRHGRMKKMGCSACHGMTGKGVERDGQLLAPAYGDSVIVKNNPEMMALILLEGIDADGSPYGAAMNGFEQVYSDRDLAAVMTFVRNRWGGHDDYISEAQAAEWRSKYAGRTSPVTQEELVEAR